MKTSSLRKTHVKRLPDGTEIKEIHKETRPPDVKAALWWLERRFPEEFGRRLEHSGSLDTGPKTITVEQETQQRKAQADLALATSLRDKAELQLEKLKCRFTKPKPWER